MTRAAFTRQSRDGSANTSFAWRQITEALAPTTLDIFNDSHLHSHHQAMEGSTSKETHFR